MEKDSIEDRSGSLFEHLSILERIEEVAEPNIDTQQMQTTETEEKKERALKRRTENLRKAEAEENKQMQVNGKAEMDAGEQVEVPKKKRKLIHIQLRQGQSTSAVVPVTQQNSLSGKEIRQQGIVNKILSCGPLTLEEICQKPINRLNIARTLNDILELSKEHDVKLSED